MTSRHVDRPRIESLGVSNFRALRQIKFRNLTPMTVLLGPNGSGKSTILDAFAFLAEIFGSGLRNAVDKRGRFKELRTRGIDGPIAFELKYREKKNSPLVTYHLEIDEDPKGPFVAREYLSRRLGAHGRAFRFLDFSNGVGTVVAGEWPGEEDARISEKLDSRDLLAVNALGQLSTYKRVSALRRFILDWRLSYLSSANILSALGVVPQESLNSRKDNLPDVIHCLNDDSFERPVIARSASAGNLKMLGYVTLLTVPNLPPLIGIEAPEDQVHPRLLPELAELCRNAATSAQLMITTHSPLFLNALRSNEAWVLYRTAEGFTQARRVSEIGKIKEFMAEGALLGQLWMAGHFEVGDPLHNAGAETPSSFPRLLRGASRNMQTWDLSGIAGLSESFSP